MGNPEDEAEREAGRQGRVAIHHGKPRDACPHGEDSPLRKHWLDGWDAVKKRGVGRPDMSPARGAGYRAFQDGLRHNECPYDPRTQDANEWCAGWRDAEENKRKRDADDALAPTLLLAPQSSLKSPAYPCLERKSQRWPDVKCSLPARVLDPRRLVLELVEVP